MLPARCVLHVAKSPSCTFSWCLFRRFPLPETETFFLSVRFCTHLKNKGIIPEEIVCGALITQIYLCVCLWIYTYILHVYMCIWKTPRWFMSCPYQTLSVFSSLIFLFFFFFVILSVVDHLIYFFL